MTSIWILGIVVLAFARSVRCSGEKFGGTDNPLLVNLTLIQSAAATGAVCLDGTLPGYHLHNGFGSGVNSWLVHLEGGGWCNSIRTCVYRKTTPRGSSKYMEKVLAFNGILSNKPYENPDFYNWNRVKLRYCDGASFNGEGFNEAASLQFRGQRIWVAAMKDLMSIGMKDATQALLSGCSAGGLASILHCDEFHDLFLTISHVAGSVKQLARITESLAPGTTDPRGYWTECKSNYAKCNGSQIQFLQNFRNELLNSLKGFSLLEQNGLFINSCFAHCQTEGNDTWFGTNFPAIANQGIAKSVGDWFFDRRIVQETDCPYPCDNTCRNIIFDKSSALL